MAFYVQGIPNATLRHKRVTIGRAWTPKAGWRVILRLGYFALRTPRWVIELLIYSQTPNSLNRWTGLRIHWDRNPLPAKGEPIFLQTRAWVLREHPLEIGRTRIVCRRK